MARDTHRVRPKVLYHFRTLEDDGKEGSSLLTETQAEPRPDKDHAAPPVFHDVNTVAMKNQSPFPKFRFLNQASLSKRSAYFFFSLEVCSLRTFLTIFCSSIRKARTILSRTQLPHLEPPYARCTVFLGLEIWEYSRGRRAGICVVSNVSFVRPSPVCYLSVPEGRSNRGVVLSIEVEVLRVFPQTR